MTNAKEGARGAAGLGTRPAARSPCECQHVRFSFTKRPRVDGNELNRLRLGLHYYFCLKLFNIQKRRIGERWGRGAR